MKIKNSLLLGSLIMASSLSTSSYCQTSTSAISGKSDAALVKGNERQPGPGENLPISAGNSELGYITPEYVKDKKFWSDDAGLAIAAIAVIAIVCGGFFFFSKKRK